MIYTNYYTAKKVAERRGLVECAYGDTPYSLRGEQVCFVCYNKTGDPNDGVVVDCYYTMEKTERGAKARARQLAGDREQLLKIAEIY